MPASLTVIITTTAVGPHLDGHMEPNRCPCSIKRGWETRVKQLNGKEEKKVSRSDDVARHRRRSSGDLREGVYEKENFSLLGPRSSRSLSFHTLFDLICLERVMPEGLRAHVTTSVACDNRTATKTRQLPFCSGRFAVSPHFPKLSELCVPCPVYTGRTTKPTVPHRR